MPLSTARRRRATVAALTALASAGSLVAFAQGAGDTGPQSFAFVARGDNPVDALAAAPVAGRLDAPIYLTRTTALSEAARAGLAAAKPDVVVVAGGTGAVSDATFAQIVDLLPDATVRRVRGDSRYETAGALAELLDEYDPAFLPGGSDLTGLATLQDLRGLLTVDDLGNYVTTDDLAGVATTTDLAGYATLSDLDGMATTQQLEGYLSADTPSETRITVLGHSGLGDGVAVGDCGSGWSSCGFGDLFPLLIGGASYPNHTFQLEAALERRNPGDEVCVRLVDRTAATPIVESETCVTQAGVQVVRSGSFTLGPDLHKYAVEYDVTGADGAIHALTLVARR